MSNMVEYIRKNRLIIPPTIFSFENYYICIDDSNIISAYKRLGYSSVECIIGGNEQRVMAEIKKYMKDSVNASDYGSKGIATTIAGIERSWQKLFRGTSIENNFFASLAEATGIPEEILTRAVKTREPTGITKEDVSNAIFDIKTGVNRIKKIDKISERYCPHCGNIENLKLSNTDMAIIPHYISAAILSKIGYILHSVPHSAHESTMRLVKDGVQKLITKKTRWNKPTNQDEDSIQQQ